MKKKEAKQSGAFFRELSTVVREHATYGKISSPDLATEFIEAHYGDATREHFGVILLDSRHAVIGYSVCSIGTANSSLVHPRETFTIAIREQAAAIIVWHNHPSGDTSPSSEDLAITNDWRARGRFSESLCSII